MERIQEPERRNIGSIRADIYSLLNDFHDNVLPPTCDEFLTRLLFNISPDVKSDSSELMNILKSLAGPRQVCQYQFKANDIVWICRQCQKDETCVLCNDCYQHSCHDGHDVFFYHSAAGGCCDCGDYDAWDYKGFCSHHGTKVDDPVSFIPAELVERSSEIFKHLLSSMAEQFTHFAGLLNGEYASITAPTLLPDDNSYSILLYYSEFHLPNELNDIISAPEVTNFLRSPNLTFTAEHANTGYKSIYTTWKVSPHDDAAHKRDVLEKANFLKQRGLQIAVFSRRDSSCRETVVGILDWIQQLALINDGMCKLICKALDVPTLTQLMRVNMKLDRQICKRFHNLLLTLMADQAFKMDVAIAYTNCFSVLVQDHRSGFGISSNSVFSLSVQFLNREYFVNEISYMYSYLSIVASSLCDLILDELGGIDLKSKVVVRRRYNPIMSDLKIVFIVPEIGRFFITSCMQQWLKLLTAAQCMHRQKRSISMHVDFEDRDWMNAFNLYLSLSSLFEHLFVWFASESSIEPLETRVTSVTKLAPSEPVAGPLSPILSIKNIISSGMSFFGKSSSSSSSRIAAAVQSPEAGSSSSKESATHYVAMNTLSSAADTFNVILSAVISWQRAFLSSHCSLYTVSSLHNYGASLRLYEFPNMATEFSFHIPLHRFLSATISEAMKYPHHLPMVTAALDKLDTLSDHLRDMIDIPLLSVVFATQVKLGMWRRNGNNMYDQLLNYANAPYCRVYKDQDRLLIQFILLEYPAADFVTHLFHRFLVKECLKSHDLRAYDSYVREAEYFSGLLDESLQFLIHICSELPPPPHVDQFTRLRSRLQKELIHRLIAGPATYSQIQECFSIYPDFQKLQSERVDDIIAEVADKQLSSGLKPPTFTLKKSFWSSYDPAFPHILDTAHQTAHELRPKLVCNQPIVPPPMESHPCFQDLSHRLLLDPSLLHVIRDLFLAAAAERCKSPVYQPILSSWTITITEAVYARIIHILTLILHTVATQSSTADGSNPDSRKDFLADFILSQPISSSDVENSLPRLSSLPSLLCALVDLKSYCALGSASSDRAYWLGWILDQCEALGPRCESFIKAKLNVGEGAKTLADMEAMKMKTREKAMADMKASAEAFMSAFGDISDSEDEDDGDGNEEDNAQNENGKEDLDKMIVASDELDQEKEANASSDPSSAKKGSESSGDQQLADESNTCPRCIICHQGVEGGDSAAGLGFDHLNPIGYLALCQSSTALLQSHPMAKASDPYSLAPSIAYEKTDDLTRTKKNQLNECNMHVNFCGHAMHYSCAEEYWSKVLTRSPLYKSIYLDIEGKQFSCPLCKKLNNILIPFVSSAPTSVATSSSDGLVDSSSVVVDMLDWIRAPTLSPDKKTSGLKRTRMDSESEIIDVVESGDFDINQVTKSVEYEVIMHIDTRYSDFREATVDWPERYTSSSLTEVRVFYIMLLNRNLRDFSSTVFDVSFAQPVTNRKHLFTKGPSAGGVVSLNSNALQDIFPEQFVKEFRSEPSEAHSLSSTDLVGEAVPIFQPLFDMIPHLEILVSAIAYTICCDCALQKSSVSKDTGRRVATSESQFLHKIIDVLTWTLIHNNCQSRVSDGLMQLLKGGAGAGAGAKGSGKGSGESVFPARDKYHQIHWMSSFLSASFDSCQSSLLSVPLLDFLVLFTATAQADGRDVYNTISPIEQPRPVGAEKASCMSSNVEYCVSWICIARLVQIMLTMLPELIDCERHATDADMLKDYSSFAPLLREIYGRLMRAGLLDKVVRSSVEKSAGPATSTPATVVQNVLIQWLAFLQAVESLLFRIPRFCHIVGNVKSVDIETKADDLDPSGHSVMDTEKAILEQLQALSGLGCLLQFCCGDGEESKTSKAAFFCVIDGWIDDFVSTMHQSLDEKQEVQAYLTHSTSDWTVLLSTVFAFYPITVYKHEVGRVKPAGDCSQMACYSTYPYPLFRDSRPRLFDLPREYTKLHATICAHTEYKYDHPAICLVCGTLLNSGGMRQCSLHAQTCNGSDGGGVFFLLQECTVLLCSGYRCAYFPTPYVDIYGESHDSFRGKPLHLDNRIYGMINNMWLEHKISREIYSIRTSSNRLIILGYY